MRAFISIDFPDEVKERIKKIQAQLPEFSGKLTEFENLHLTLKFLGEISEKEAEDIERKLKEVKIKRFEAEINEIGVFSERFVRIIWLHITNCDELQREIDEKLSEFFAKENRFMSHVTIARVKKIENKMKFIEQLKEVKIEKIKFNVDGFYLKQSFLHEKGPEYKVVGEYKLV